MPLRLRGFIRRFLPETHYFSIYLQIRELVRDAKV